MDTTHTTTPQQSRKHSLRRAYQLVAARILSIASIVALVRRFKPFFEKFPPNLTFLVSILAFRLAKDDFKMNTKCPNYVTSAIATMSQGLLLGLYSLTEFCMGINLQHAYGMLLILLFPVLLLYSTTYCNYAKDDQLMLTLTNIYENSLIWVCVKLLYDALIATHKNWVYKVFAICQVLFPWHTILFSPVNMYELINPKNRKQYHPNALVLSTYMSNFILVKLLFSFLVPSNSIAMMIDNYPKLPNQMAVFNILMALVILQINVCILATLKLPQELSVYKLPGYFRFFDRSQKKQKRN